MSKYHGFRILMADDVVRYHRLYEFAIKDAMPAEVQFACDGQQALDALQKRPFDLLILDLNMPVMDGEQVLRTLRSNPNFDNMPIIILTGDSAAGTQKRLLEMGANDFIEKGSPPELFVARLRAQSRFKLTLDRLAKLAVDRDVFAAGVLHDIRNLETTIMAVSDLACEYLKQNPEGNKDVMLGDLAALEKKAAHLGEYATGIINMVRDTRTPPRFESLELPPLIHWVQKIIQPSRVEETPELAVTIAGDLLPVQADRNLLQLALLNIMQNAVKYRRPDTPPAMTISQSVSPKDGAGGTRVTTRFRDHGRGIRKSELRKIFKPFVRGFDNTGQESGFGLGLSMVAKVITTMSGYVWAELPESGPGTIFCVDLPQGKGD